VATSVVKAERRTLVWFFVIIIALAGGLVAANRLSNSGLAPKLGLDLEGGTQIILEPRLTTGQQVSQEQVDAARDIIVERIDAAGFSGAEVTTQGGRNIVVSMPGTPSAATKDAIRKSSKMDFRGVLLAEPTQVPAPTPTGTATGTATTPTGTATKPATGTATSKAVPSVTAGTSAPKAALPGAYRAATTPTPTGTTPAATTTPSAPATTGGAPGTGTAGTPGPNDVAWITPEIRKQFDALDCAKPGVLDNLVAVNDKPLVTCSEDGSEKYVLGPVIVGGDGIADASAGYRVNQQGQTTSQVEIQLSFKGSATKTYGDASARMVTLQSPLNRMAAVLDNRVIVAPSFNEAIPNGQASITGNFTIESARALAQQLKFGALPISFTQQTETSIGAILGEEQLRIGLLAGLVGFLLVILYSLLQYRALGLVTVASLVAATVLTFLTITLLGWAYNFRLDMAGVTGCIVAIGVTADSFIVYFERIRDEVREGRALTSAVEAGWSRAKRTILAADGVNFLAAIVLYGLASANVRGFAFTLGLTTLIDLLIVVMFTHPVVALLARTKFFGGGHRLSGLDPDRLGAKIRYAGRGRVVLDPTPTRRARPTLTGENEGAVV
jgi:preprotein translocase subunit SecD